LGEVPKGKTAHRLPEAHFALPWSRHTQPSESVGRRGKVFERRVRQEGWGAVVPDLSPASQVGSVELHKAQWLLSARWRRKASKVCARVELSFTEWLIIDALRELHRELDDAVSQNALAARAGLARRNISESMPKLEEKGLVSRGPSASGRALRLFPTQEAVRRLDFLYPLLEAISRPAAALL